MKRIFQLGFILSLLFVSCSRYIAPPYTSMDKVIQLKPGMSVESVGKTIGLEPYEIYVSDGDSKMTVLYKYRLKGRRMTVVSPSPNERESKIRSEDGQMAGELWYEKTSRTLYVTFDNGQMKSYVTSKGRFDGEALSFSNNNIKKINKEELNSYILLWQKLAQLEKERLEREKKRKEEGKNSDNQEEDKVDISTVDLGIGTWNKPSNSISDPGNSGVRRNKGGNPWEKIKGFLAFRVNLGAINSNNMVRQENISNPFYESATGFELTYGTSNSAFGIYRISAGASTSYNYSGGYKFSNVRKTGVCFKKYFSELSSRFRPYALIGAGITSEDSNKSSGYYGAFHMQGRIGFDFYLLRFFGLNMETGFGANNLLSFGFSYRINHR